MKRAGEEKQQGGPLQASKVDKRGLYFGESTRGPHGFTVDRGGQYLMRTGFEPSVCPIGGGGVSSPSASLGSEGLLFEGVGDDLVRRTSSGHYEPVGLERLCGRSVALLFGLGMHPKCTSFVPFLAQFYKNVNEEGGRPKVEVVYVDLDSDPQAFEESRKSMPWLSLQFSSPVRSKLIRRYGLRVEPRGYASLPNCVVLGLPRMLVVGPRGEEMQWLPCEHESPVVLREWDYAAFRWPPAAAADSRGDSAGSSSRKETCKHSGETQEQIDWDWPLKPEVAAAWPREWERRQQHRHDENS